MDGPRKYQPVCFLIRDRKAVDPVERGGGKNVIGAYGGETIIKMFCEGKNILN